MQRKIAIIGTGYVGLTAGICLAYLGHKVICLDNDKSKIKKLRKGIIPIFEPELAQILKKHRNNIEFSSDLKQAVKRSEVIFITVGTPPKKDGSIDMREFKNVVKEIAKSINDYKVVVSKSTVSVGTGDWIKKEIKKYYKGSFSLVSNPEFLREGFAINDFLKPDRIVIGLEDKKAKEIMFDIYSSIKAPKIITDISSAELIKYAANAFLATKISFINEIANFCEKINGDVIKIKKGIGTDKRIGSKFLNAGIGYSGSCFPKDIDGLIKMADHKKYDFKLLKAVVKVNEEQQKRFIKKIKRTLKKVNGKKIAIWGLAFKPNTDDIRKSLSIEIIKSLLKAGYKIQAYDPIILDGAKKELAVKNIQFCKSPFEAVKKADVLALLTDWPEFKNLDMKKVKNLMNHPYFFDGRNQFEPEKLKKIGFYYQGVGRK